MNPVTFEVPGRDSLTFDVSRLDFATREELLDAFSADGARVHLGTYIRAALLALGCGLDVPADVAEYRYEPVPFGRAVYSWLRAQGVSRLAVIEAGNSAFVATANSLAPTDAEVAARQDFTQGAA